MFGSKDKHAPTCKLCIEQPLYLQRAPKPQAWRLDKRLMHCLGRCYILHCVQAIQQGVPHSPCSGPPCRKHAPAPHAPVQAFSSQGQQHHKERWARHPRRCRRCRRRPACRPAASHRPAPGTPPHPAAPQESARVGRVGQGVSVGLASASASAAPGCTSG